jgi:Fe-S cluster assembly ATP-binding protein
MLTVSNLHAGPVGVPVLKGLNLTVRAGEVHALMGPNGTGKSTLSHVIAGRKGYEITGGAVTFEGHDLAPLSVAERSRLGIFLAFQYPVEIPGVACMNFLKTAVNSARKSRGEEEVAPVDFLKTVRAEAIKLGMSDEMLKRSVNSGFSGGEKKRFEALQMALLKPKLAILDETDSGLDIDALRTVADGVNALRSPDRAFLVITHYKRLLDYVAPDFVHILHDGRIVASGGIEIAERLEKDGYKAFGIADAEEAA